MTAGDWPTDSADRIEIADIPTVSRRVRLTLNNFHLNLSFSRVQRSILKTEMMRTCLSSALNLLPQFSFSYFVSSEADGAINLVIITPPFSLIFKCRQRNPDKQEIKQKWTATISLNDCLDHCFKSARKCPSCFKASSLFKADSFLVSFSVSHHNNRDFLRL